MPGKIARILCEIDAPRNQAIATAQMPFITRNGLILPSKSLPSPPGMDVMELIAGFNPAEAKN